MTFREQIIRLAYEKPELRSKLLPLLTEGTDKLARSNDLRRLAAKIADAIVLAEIKPYEKKALWTIVSGSLRQAVVEVLPDTEVYLNPSLNGPGKFTARKNLIEIRPGSDKSQILHEVIHALDYARAGGARGRGRGDYFNDPLELNAYFEQGFDAFETHVQRQLRKSDDPEWDAAMLLSATDTMLTQTLLKWFHRDWVKALTPQNRKAILKRLYQSVVDLREEYGAGI